MDFYERFRLGRVWPWVLLAVLAFFAAVQFMKVNMPDIADVTEPSGTPVNWTRGAIFTGPQVVPGGRFLAARLDLNKRSYLDGRFKVTTREALINCLLLPADQLENWKAGQDYKRVAETGYVPSGRIARQLDPGSYYLILDNQSSPQDREVEANFSVE